MAQPCFVGESPVPLALHYRETFARLQVDTFHLAAPAHLRHLRFDWLPIGHDLLVDIPELESN